ncbi:MAG TPA: FAD-dependent monooxygenase [Actinocrinis sp.]|jgi:2-polyprenyl-6-methoxyphenol hydroxylase-like FAD-dependent oxidoreductase
MTGTVIIAGGGPAGLMLACELRLAGVEAVVLEERPEPIPWSRSMALHTRSIEALRQRGFDFFEGARPWSSYNFGFLELTRILDDPAQIPLLVPQLDVERALEARARETGADIRPGHQVVGLVQDEHGVEVEVRTATGDYRIRGDYLAGCDGGRSAVRKLAGIEFPGTASRVHGVTADVEFASEVPSEINARLYPAGLFASGEFEPGVHRVTSIEFDVQPPGREVPMTIDEVRESARRVAGVELDIRKVRWVARFGDATRQATAYRSGRVFLAGDAAHIHFPSAGQGLNTSIQDALNLGWKLAGAIKGWGGSALLDTYHAERHPIGARVCMYSSAQVALYHPLDKVGPLRELFSELLRLKQVSTHLLGLSTGLGLRYPMEYPGIARTEAPHPLLGGRAPDVKLAKDGGVTSVAATLQSGRGVLLDLTGSDTVGAVAAGWSDRVDTVAAQPVEDLDAAVVLIRPDGYVAHADRDGRDVEGLRAALSWWFGAPAR